MNRNEFYLNSVKIKDKSVRFCFILNQHAQLLGLDNFRIYKLLSINSILLLEEYLWQTLQPEHFSLNMYHFTSLTPHKVHGFKVSPQPQVYLTNRKSETDVAGSVAIYITDRKISPGVTSSGSKGSDFRGEDSALSAMYGTA